MIPFLLPSVYLWFHPHCGNYTVGPNIQFLLYCTQTELSDFQFIDMMYHVNIYTSTYLKLNWNIKHHSRRTYDHIELLSFWYFLKDVEIAEALNFDNGPLNIKLVLLQVGTVTSSILLLLHLIPPSAQGQKRPGKVSASHAEKHLVVFKKVCICL